MTHASTLVLGAGELGMAVLRGLAEQGDAANVAVLLRPQATPDAAKQRDREELRRLGIRVVAGDLGNGPEEELGRVFGGFETVVGCTGFVAGAGTQRKLARVALRAGVQRYVPWQFGVDYDVIGRGSAQDLFDEQLDVRSMLRGQSRTAWLVVSTGMFTSFLFEPSFGVVDLQNSTVHALGSPETEVTVTAAEDIGRLTAAILLAEPRLENRVVYTAGDTLSYARLADIVERVRGQSVRRLTWTVPELRQELAAEPDDALRKYRVVFAEGRGVAWPVTQTFNGQNGLPVQDAESWAKANLPGATSLLPR